MSDENTDTLRGMLRMQEVAKRIGVHKQTIYRWVRENQFPRPVPLSDTTVAFFEDEVAAWQKKRAARDAPPDETPDERVMRRGGMRPPRHPRSR